MALTRLVNSVLTQQSATGATTLTWTLPKVGMLSRIALISRLTISGTLSSPNALGVSAVFDRIRLTGNVGIDIFNVSGPGYAYLLQEMLDDAANIVTPQNQGRSAVATGTFNLDMVFPIALNQASDIGLVMLQNESTTLSLSVTTVAPTTLATGASYTLTVQPVVYYHPVPTENLPPLNVIHRILEESRSVTAGENTYDWPRANVYLGIAFGAGIGASGADNWSDAKLVLGKSQTIFELTPAIADLQHQFIHGRARPAGGVYFNFLAQGGQGDYSAPRDTLNSAVYTDIGTQFTISASGTLYVVRRELVFLPT